MGLCATFILNSFKTSAIFFSEQPLAHGRITRPRWSAILAFVSRSLTSKETGKLVVSG